MMPRPTMRRGPAVMDKQVSRPPTGRPTMPMDKQVNVQPDRPTMPMDKQVNVQPSRPTAPMPGPQVSRPPSPMGGGMKKGGKVSSASSRGDGIAQRGKTKGRFV
jgi:hypothetical protein